MRIMKLMRFFMYKSGNLSANTLQKSGNQEIKIINKGDINSIDLINFYLN